MSYPQKSSDLRSIIINGTKYLWRFTSGGAAGRLVIYGPKSGHQALSVHLLEWRDEWLAFPEPTDNHPKIIGPAFVRQAIEFGLTNGWYPATKGAPKRLEWASGHFRVSK